MRIAIVASPVTPIGGAQVGGAQSVICDLAQGLARRGHAVQVHCAEGSNLPGVELITVPVPPDAAAALVLPGGPQPRPTPGVAAAIDTMFSRISDHMPDAISVHAFDAPAMRAAATMPALCTLHMPPLVDAVVEAVRVVPAIRLVTVSQACRRDWNAVGIPVSNVLRNGVCDIPVPEQPADRVALIAGRISPEKGVDHALLAAKAAGLRSRVAGAHYDPGYAIDLSDAEVVGSLRQDQLRQLMARSAVTICAVRWEEPFGLVAAEAQMAGCPVAAYRRGAMPEVVDDGVSGFLAAPDDIEDLTAAIGRCLTLERASVRRSALSRLHVEGMLDGYEKALGSIAA
ncbi:MAG TPA: glycosyltransferase [Candidatus Dormibacteraeota bacterium]|jgi:glycosyltransferase involved in cell wall biosynthesis